MFRRRRRVVISAKATVTEAGPETKTEACGLRSTREKGATVSVTGNASKADGDRRSGAQGSPLSSAVLTAGDEVAKNVSDKPGRRIGPECEATRRDSSASFDR